jgi:hypothetical protein
MSGAEFTKSMLEDDYKEATDSVIPPVIPSRGNQVPPKEIKKSKNPEKDGF